MTANVVSREAEERTHTSEQRVAELAAKGMTNRDVAAELFISPKTVEANLSVFTASSASTRGRSSAAE